MLNTQPILKQENKFDGDKLYVHSIFPTIQGEGPFVGHPAVFIRLGGCNLRCPGCDTDYTEGTKLMETGRIIDQVQNLKSRGQKPLVVITGGEPFRQNIGKLINTLLVLNFQVQIETNGTLFVETLKWDHPGLTIICSPKAGKINENLEPFIFAYKYVLRYGSVDHTDGLPILALDHSASPRVARPKQPFPIIYVQPMDEKDDAKNQRNMHAAVHSATTFGYILCLQVHKIIGVE